MDGLLESESHLDSSDDGHQLLARCSDAGSCHSSAASSDFSSCDRSDVDRYCSANSVLGSASICSSVGNWSGMGDDMPLEGYSLREKLLNIRNDYPSDGGAETSVGNGASGSPLARIRASSTAIHCSNESYLSFDEMREEDDAGDLRLLLFSKSQKMSAFGVNCSSLHACDDDVSGICERKDKTMENLGNSLNGTHLNPNIHGGEKHEADDDVLSKFEHSDAEDSMFSYGNDDDGVEFHGRKSYNVLNERNHENVNPLVMNSSVVFGCNDWDEFEQETAGGCLDSFSVNLDNFVWQKDKHIQTLLEKEVADISEAHCERQVWPLKEVGDLNHILATSIEEKVIDPPAQNFREDYDDLPTKYSEYVSNAVLGDAVLEDNAVKCFFGSKFNGIDRTIESLHGKQDTGMDAYESSEKHLQGESELPLYPLSSHRDSMWPYDSLKRLGSETMRHEIDKSSYFASSSIIGEGSSVQSAEEKNPGSVHLAEVAYIENEVKNAYEIFDETVLEMEEILLDSEKSHGSMISHQNPSYISLQLRHTRDGSSTASTSGADDINAPFQVPSKIDWVEVVGAKQKKGDVSLGERLVGVREHTIYRIKVWGSMDEWEVERRYRDFFALYRQLKVLFTGHGLNLPSTWSCVEHESRKIFGNASPNVIKERSTLIEDCLRSILNARYSFGTPSPLISFLTPGKTLLKPGMLQSLVPLYLKKLVEHDDLNFGETHLEDAPILGKTITLVVEIKPHKSLRQLLEMQQYKCAGCHRHLDAGRTLFRELVQTIGWNRPRYCEYTCQLFCSTCHTNDSSVLPARVLHRWDFSLYPVSQLAKAYLESIYDQPMLCVSAVNPFLFSKVPALLHVMGLRKKIGLMLPYVKCPFRSSIQKSLGFRKHILECTEFFALRDLVDLSKGPFAALPMMAENISNLILEHITQQCLVCYDSGIPCSAHQACHDPSSLIFPFQEAEAEKCSSCGSIFHKDCYVNLLGCPCRTPRCHSRWRRATGTREAKTTKRAHCISRVTHPAKPAPCFKSSNRRIFLRHLLQGQGR
ncbi:hypothetical protein HPP92_009707 [Vanilla planifolia]|uniref:PX domain-containing protein n=1 Tax=Vanilla planifolia TaxID=51239 RepID=A0A835RFV2_VANPL|nr:hypothetical protein HPP92_009707 [Vanilla planifolia]